MKSEMPVKYWKNLPEADLIPALVSKSGARTEQMIGDAPERLDRAFHADAILRPAPLRLAPKSLEELYALLKTQTDAPRAGFAEKFIAGEGPLDAAIMLLGEQPGDIEDREGRPFAGPAGALLDKALAAAGVDRTQLFITNAVKRFKFLPRGKRRIHQTPSAADIKYYRWWVEQERLLVRPKLTIALGATAARSLTGKPVKVSQFRGQVIREDGDRSFMVTVHPSYLLRIPDIQGRQVEFEKFVREIAKAKSVMP